MNILVDLSKRYLLRIIENYINQKSVALYDKIRENGYYVQPNEVTDMALDYIEKHGGIITKQIGEKLVKKIKKFKNPKMHKIKKLKYIKHK